MVLLPLIWSGMGIVIGLMAYVARLQPMAWRHSKRLNLLYLLLISALLPLPGGWLGVLLFGRLFSIATALWVTIAGITLLPWGIGRIQTALKRNQERGINT